MNKKELLQSLSTIKHGRLFRITYKRLPKLSAWANKAGYVVIQYTEKTTRTGVDYLNIQRVKDKKAQAEPNTVRHYINEWGHYTVKNVLYEHNTKGTQYLCLAPLIKGSNVKSKYILTTPEGEVKQVAKSYLIDRGILQGAEANKDIPEIERIDIENIIKIEQRRKLCLNN